MKTKLLSLNKEVVGDIALNKAIFGLELRSDIIKRVIDWQRAKAMSGSHKTKNVGEVSGTTRKPFKQKGTGNARQGNNRAVQLRGGGVAHGPVIRSHAIKLQKKVRVLGLKHALSVKLSEGSLFVIDSMKMTKPKTSDLIKSLAKFGNGKFFMIDGKAVDENLKLSASSAIYVNAVPAIGANVYDIINSNFVLISKEAVTLLEERLNDV
ncbi:MAG: 50S ribosomal protein L4 [Rickettsiaceae bacterium]|nr:50S ribosomal protein L4 [Rickettsiaceae bacterium]